MEKEVYEPIEMEIIEFEDVDIIIASYPEGEKSDDEGENT